MSDAGYSMLGAGAWGWPREMLWGGRSEGGSCLGTHVRIKDFKIKKIKNLKKKKKGNQPWIFIGWTDAEAEAPMLWQPGAKSQLTGKDPDAGKDWRQREKRATEDEMARQPHWFNGHELEQTLGDSGGQGSLVCCSPWGHKESTWLSKWTANIPGFEQCQY